MVSSVAVVIVVGGLDSVLSRIILLREEGLNFVFLDGRWVMITASGKENSV